MNPRKIGDSKTILNSKFYAFLCSRNGATANGTDAMANVPKVRDHKREEKTISWSCNPAARVICRSCANAGTTRRARTPRRG